jgi:two-component system, NtrC family, sensor kinase
MHGVLGYDPEDIIGRQAFDTPLEEILIRDALERDIDLGALPASIELFETRVKDIRGRWHVLEVSGKRLTNQIVGVAREITERKKMEEQLIRASKLASVGVLAAGIAHQINNPLAIMVLSTTALKDILDKMDDETRKRTDKYLNTLDRQIERTRKVVSGLLAFAKDKRSQVKSSNVNSIVNEAVNFLQQPLSADAINLKLDLARNLPPALVDAVALQQVMVNLIQNAIEAMNGEGDIEIKTGKGDRDLITITVADSGPGIPEHMKEEIFEPLFTTKAPGKGTGLGLSLSVLLLEKFNGRIYVQGNQEKGSIFVVEVPARLEDKHE